MQLFYGKGTDQVVCSLSRKELDAFMGALEQYEEMLDRHYSDLDPEGKAERKVVKKMSIDFINYRQD